MPHERQIAAGRRCLRALRVAGGGTTHRGTMNLQEYSDKDLIKLHRSIIAELIERGVVRTRNNPVGDYAEWLCAKFLKAAIETNSKKGYDLKDAAGVRYQVKARMDEGRRSNRQLSAVRSLSEHDFDHLIAIFFDSGFDVSEAYLLPHKVVKQLAIYQDHTNAHKIILSKEIIRKTPEIEDIVDRFREVDE